ncbi:MAG TPA: PASTA domain-containing protein [Kofleriaceae bacterium]|jgi:beta-lactam-binding protein with PASTA domain
MAFVALAVTPTSADDKLKVPSLIGKMVEDAQNAAISAGFPQDLYVETAGPDCKGDVKDNGKVKCQSPAPGTVLGRYEHITVYVVRIAQKKKITKDDTDAVIGKMLDEAKQMLGWDGYKGKITLEESDSCQMNQVCAVKPTEFMEDDPITIVTKTKEKVNIAPPP